LHYANNTALPLIHKKWLEALFICVSLSCFSSLMAHYDVSFAQAILNGEFGKLHNVKIKTNGSTRIKIYTCEKLPHLFIPMIKKRFLATALLDEAGNISTIKVPFLIHDNEKIEFSDALQHVVLSKKKHGKHTFLLFETRLTQLAPNFLVHIAYK
jgi:hypothetical protein